MTQQRVSPVVITSVLPATVTLSVQGALGQSVNLQEWRSSSGAVISLVDSNGRVSINNATAPGGAALQVSQPSGGYGVRIFGSGTAASPLWIETAAGAVGATIRGAASQMADYLQIQNSAGSVRAYISAGAVIGTAVGFANLANTGTYLDTSTNTMTFIQRVAATPVLAVRGATSQSGNLQEWQDSSANILAKVASDGTTTALGYSTTNAYVTIGEQNTGGSLRLGKQSTTATAPGAGFGRLYFRDGTNANTLKLVVRAGTGGAETTILDNIPIF